MKDTLCLTLDMPVTFYLPNYDRLDTIDSLDPFQAWKEMPRGEGFWILQTYCLLKNYGFSVNISAEVPAQGIMVFHRRNKSILFDVPNEKLKNLILVGCRGDLHDVLVADFELLQNSFFSDGEKRFVMPHWPMPNIVKRDPDRGVAIKRIGFKGFAAQLHDDFKSEEWKNFLASKNIEWVQNAVTFTTEGGSAFDDSAWNDYHAIDMVIAVRPDRNELHTNKPALKLINAWLAGVPAILGREVAYQEIGIKGVDYIEASNITEAKQAIELLINHPEKYQSIIDNGFLKSQAFTHEAVAQAWIEFFNKVPALYASRKKSLLHQVAKSIPLSVRYIGLFLLKTITFQRMR